MRSSILDSHKKAGEITAEIVKSRIKNFVLEKVRKSQAQQRAKNNSKSPDGSINDFNASGSNKNINQEMKKKSLVKARRVTVVETPLAIVRTGESDDHSYERNNKRDDPH